MRSTSFMLLINKIKIVVALLDGHIYRGGTPGAKLPSTLMVSTTVVSFQRIFLWIL